MTSHWLFQLAVLAVLAFWLIGAYNRLMRLRNAVTGAWDQIEPVLLRRSEAMSRVVATVRERLDAEAGTLQALLEADARQRQAADAVRAARARADEVSQWVVAEAALASPASRLRSLIELQTAAAIDAGGGAELNAAMAAWAEAEPRLAFARQAFNDAAATYNRALQQWPTRLLTTLFGHRAAGRV